MPCGFLWSFFLRLFSTVCLTVPAFPTAPLPAKSGLSEPTKTGRKEKKCWGSQCSQTARVQPCHATCIRCVGCCCAHHLPSTLVALAFYKGFELRALEMGVSSKLGHRVLSGERNCKAQRKTWEREPKPSSLAPLFWTQPSIQGSSRSNGNHKMPYTFREALLLRHWKALHLLPFRDCVSIWRKKGVTNLNFWIHVK